MAHRKPPEKMQIAMAPTKAAIHGVKKSKSKPKRGKIRRLENGLLDVERKGKYMPM
jgi:hypothetical protein